MKKNPAISVPEKKDPVLEGLIKNRLGSLNKDRDGSGYACCKVGGMWGIFLRDGKSMSTVIAGVQDKRTILHVLDAMVNFKLFEELARNGQIVNTRAAG